MPPFALLMLAAGIYNTVRTSSSSTSYSQFHTSGKAVLVCRLWGLHLPRALVRDSRLASCQPAAACAMPPQSRSSSAPLEISRSHVQPATSTTTTRTISMCETQQPRGSRGWMSTWTWVRRCNELGTSGWPRAIAGGAAAETSVTGHLSLCQTSVLRHPCAGQQPSSCNPQVSPCCSRVLHGVLGFCSSRCEKERAQQRSVLRCSNKDCVVPKGRQLRTASWHGIWPLRQLMVPLLQDRRRCCNCSCPSGLAQPRSNATCGCPAASTLANSSCCISSACRRTSAPLPVAQPPLSPTSATCRSGETLVCSRNRCVWSANHAMQPAPWPLNS